MASDHEPISATFRNYHEKRFDDYGPTSEGVDWGTDQAKVDLRYAKMLAIMDGDSDPRPSLLDVGCGFGGLLTYARAKGRDVAYTGMDLAANMVDWGNQNHKDAQFRQGDFFDHDPAEKFDYIVCNGIVTQKMDHSGLAMEQFSNRLIRRMFESCNRGIAINFMTTRVNFTVNRLYYRSPVEAFAWCLNEITPHVRIDHSYPLYDYTIYLLRAPR